MLRITRRTDGELIVFELEGRLAGPWVEELAGCWLEASARAPQLVLELKEITFVDASGRKLLAEMHRAGVRFHAAGCMTRSIVDEIVGAEKT